MSTCVPKVSAGVLGSRNAFKVTRPGRHNQNDLVRCTFRCLCLPLPETKSTAKSTKFDKVTNQRSSSALSAHSFSSPKTLFSSVNCGNLRLYSGCSAGNFAATLITGFVLLQKRNPFFSHRLWLCEMETFCDCSEHCSDLLRVKWRLLFAKFGLALFFSSLFLWPKHIDWSYFLHAPE